MKRTAVLVIVCVIACLATAGADEAKNRELAEELVIAMEMPQALEQSFEMMKQMIPAQMEQMGVSGDETSEEGMAVFKETMDFMAKELTWDNLKEDYITIYAETFTEEELAGLVEFYKSPVGSKFAGKQPELMKRSMELTQKQMMEIMPKIKKFAEEMKEKEAARTKDGKI